MIYKGLSKGHGVICRGPFRKPLCSQQLLSSSASHTKLLTPESFAGVLCRQPWPGIQQRCLLEENKKCCHQVFGSVCVAGDLYQYRDLHVGVRARLCEVPREL